MITANVFLFTVPLHFFEKPGRDLVVRDTVLGRDMLGHIAKIPEKALAAPTKSRVRLLRKT